MRSAEIVRRLALLSAAAALAGCSTVTDTVKAVQQAVMPSTAPAPAPAAAPAANASAAKAEPAPAPAPLFAEPAVSPQAQRAFDDAKRLLAAGRVDEAERAFRALAKAEPGLGGPHANLGLILLKAGKVDEAVAELEAATKASPRQPVFWNQLGIAYRHKGEFQKAREAYERALDLDDKYAAAQLNLGILHDLYLRDRNRAVERFDRYQALLQERGQPADPAVTKWLAELKNRKAEPQLAKKEQP